MFSEARLDLTQLYAEAADLDLKSLRPRNSICRQAASDRDRPYDTSGLPLRTKTNQEENVQPSVQGG